MGVGSEGGARVGEEEGGAEGMGATGSGARLQAQGRGQRGWAEPCGAALRGGGCCCEESWWFHLSPGGAQLRQYGEGMEIVYCRNVCLTTLKPKPDVAKISESKQHGYALFFFDRALVLYGVSHAH